MVLTGRNGSKSVTRAWNMMKEVVVHDLTEPMKMLKKCGIRCIQTVNKAYYVERLKGLSEGMCRNMPEFKPNV
jgi:hypothetical protein